MGALAIVAGFLGAAVLTPAAFAGAVGVEAQLPANAAASPQVGLRSVSCVSAGNCSAVGWYTDSSGHGQGLLLSESSGSWARGVDAQLPANATWFPTPGVWSLSCGSAGNCTAVGYYIDSLGNDHGLLLSEASGSWAPGVEAPLPGNADVIPFVFVNSVSCASAGNCTAVGNYRDSSGHEQGLLLSESSGSWAAAEAPLPANAAANPNAGLGSVSCVSVGNCTAVGGYTDSSGHQQGLLLSESSGSWAGAEAPLPANAAANPTPILASVSCASAGNCTAVGFYFDPPGLGNAQGLLLTESSGSWTATEAMVPAGLGLLSFGSVSCASAGNCTAAGNWGGFSNTGAYRPLLFSQSSGSWAPGVEAPLPANADANADAGVNSVSCPSPGNCVAVGSYIPDNQSADSHGLLLGESSGSWTATEAALPANGAATLAAGLASVSCASAGNCTAVGSYGDSSGHGQGLLESFGAAISGVPAISKLRLSPRKVSLAGRRVHGRCVKQTNKNKSDGRCRRTIKVKVSYTINIAATVKITLKREAPGRKVRDRCATPTKKNKRHKKCTRSIAVPGTITQIAQAGSDSFTFNGKIGGKTLGPGVYLLSAIPIANGVSGTPQQATFKVAG